MFRFVKLAQVVMLFALYPFSVMAVPGGQPGGTGIEATQTDVMLLVAYILLALLVSFLCSIAEAVLLSITPTYIEGLRERQPNLYMRLTQLKRDRVDRSLAAILTLNTIAHTVGAIGAGAKATVVFGNAWFGLFSTLMTLAILFLSEIIPKTFGAVHWVRLTSPTAYFIQFIVWALFPIVYVSELLTRLLSRNTSSHTVTRDEVIAMVRVGQAAGHIGSNETRMLSSLLSFNSRKLDDVMTPRTVIHALPEEMTIQDAMEEVVRLPFSRIPVYDGDIDHITGFVLRDDILLAQAENRTAVPLRELRREILTVPESKPTPDLFREILAKQQHIALVVDEHGGTAGLATLEDLMETLIGMEIVDEMDVHANMREAARSQRQRKKQSLRGSRT